MPEKVDLYNTSYGNDEVEIYAEVRRETYGRELGQTSWASLEEFAEIPRLLAIHASSSVLEIGWGAGGCALHFGGTNGFRVLGVGLNAHGFQDAAPSAPTKPLSELAPRN